MQAQRAILSVLALVALAACGTSVARTPAEARFGDDVPEPLADVLRTSPSLELLALKPDQPTTEAPRADPPRFHDFEVLGRTTVTDEATRTRALDLIGRACRENDGMTALCFDPRHGLRAEAGGRTVDLVICFECFSLRVYADGKLVHSGDLAQTQEPELSALYRAAGLTIAR